MRVLVVVVVVLNAVLAQASPKLKQVVVTDPLFNKPAFTVSIPEDWSFEGTVLHGDAGPRVVFRTASPDGLTGAQAMPLFAWLWSNDKLLMEQFAKQKLPVHEAISAADYLKQFIVPMTRPDAKIGDISPIPMVEKLHEGDKQANDQYAAAAGRGPAKHRSSDNARVRIEHGVGARAIDEAISAVMIITETPSARGGMVRETLATIASTHAPHGKLDAADPALVAILMSVTADPAWTTRMQAFMTQQAQAQNAQMAAHAAATNRAILARAEAYRVANKRTFDGSMANAKRMEDARHMGAQDTIDHIRDEKTAVNPQSGQTGKVGNQYNYSYVDDSGKVVQTNSPTFDPNAQLAGHWLTLEAPK